MGNNRIDIVIGGFCYLERASLACLSVIPLCTLLYPFARDIKGYNLYFSIDLDLKVMSPTKFC